MPYIETKVYFDGSHYIAIPHTERPPRKRPKGMSIEDMTPLHSESQDSEYLPVQEKDGKLPLEILAEAPKEIKQDNPDIQIRANVKTKKELFDELYTEFVLLPYKERMIGILDNMRRFFPDDERLEEYVKSNLEKKKRNLICRRTRMARKANLAGFNYFCTFTYNDELHTEQTFKKTLKKTFENFATRKAWKYMGVWERSPEKQRLHFHGLFDIPNGTIPGELTEKRDYSTINKRMQTTVESSYFKERFGRNDFALLDEDANRLSSAITYLMKYIEKTGERIVYSRGLYQYFISDITDDDVVCPIGQEDKKLLLFDDFKCHDEGVYMGRVSKDVIEKMRKSN